MEKFKEKRGVIIWRGALLCFVALTVFDLFYHHIRQNPLVDARIWLSPPRSAEIIKKEGKNERVFAPASAAQHVNLFNHSKGWSGDLSGYYEHRELLQPNSNLLHGIATLDGYSGISPRWLVDLIGDHNRTGFLWQLYKVTPVDLEALPAFFDWLEALSVRWLILPMRVSSERLQHMGSAPPVELYRLHGTLPRVRVLNNVRIVESLDEVWTLVATEELNIRNEVLLHDQSLAPLVAAIEKESEGEQQVSDARILIDRSTELVVEAVAKKRSLLLVADTYYPGWEATVDGELTPIFRANIAHRAVELKPGKHRVEFRFNSQAVKKGIQFSAAGILILIFLSILVLAWKPNHAK
ncbi:MAG: YfhO family protein [SAR324 cluster bacterium]|uniref:YfhO family protein n=1 Tax=SAR324 cluster bacterium TaxID=2024889 RepID=A0A7X9FSW3_9DELT|nr:YfhO family protein [SAR324 cluster bacterium]